MNVLVMAIATVEFSLFLGVSVATVISEIPVLAFTPKIYELVHHHLL